MNTRQPKKHQNPHHRGCRHLKVGIEIGAKASHVKSIWVVDQPAVQHTHLTGPIYVRIDVAGKPVLLQAFPDPRICRGVNRPKLGGHYFHMLDSALLHVTIPFDDERELTEVRVRIVDATPAKVAPTDHRGVLHLFDKPPVQAIVLTDIGIDVLRKHLDFVKVAKTLGWIVHPGSFEVFTDRDGGFRWRLRRMDDAVMAESAQAFATRAACEEDIRWVKANAAASPITSHDLPGGGCKP